MKNKFVIYTAIFGDYDELIDPKVKIENCDFICFTDQHHLKSDIWQIRTSESDLPPNLMNRKYKWLPHKFLREYEYSLYIDANIQLLKNPLSLWDKYCDSDCLMLLPKHPQRECIYQESIACVERNKTKIPFLLEQMKFYKKENFPENFGLGENNILFRKHLDKRIIELMEEIWKEINKWKTKRDQLSLFYLIWKTQFSNYKLMNEHSCDEIFFKKIPHKRFQNLNLLKKIYFRVLEKKRELINANIYKFLLRKQ